MKSASCLSCARQRDALKLAVGDYLGYIADVGPRGLASRKPSRIFPDLQFTAWEDIPVSN
jgi:hypothetical protein